MKARFLLYSLISLLSYICISCTEEDNQLFPTSETGLTIHLDMGNSNFSRAISEAEEQYDWQIEDLHVFIFDADGNIVLQGEEAPCYWHFEKDVLIQGAGTVTLMTGNWKNVFKDKDECGVYVVANLYVPKPIDDKEGNNSFSFINDLSRITTLDELKGLTDQNFQIYQPISDSKKLFTMSGCIEKWEPASSPNIYTLSVPLTRLAARIEVNIETNFNDGEIEEGYKVGIPQFELVNYTTKSLVLSGNDDTFSDRVWASDDGFSANQSNINQNQFVAYTYPNEWNSDILHETYVLVNVPFIKDNTVEFENNYYKVPLRLSTDDKKLERNHWYRITAKISSKGNVVPDNPVTLTDVHYEVAPWYDTKIDINGDTPLYLELSEYDVVMRNVDTYDLTFASSSQIVKAPTDVTSQKAEIEIKEIYYKNKYGKKIDLKNDENIIDNTYLSVEGGLNGHLVIHSPIPVNKTIRYITLTVKNAQYVESNSGTHSCIKTVTIKQYPLEYITGISGLYSYLDEDKYTGAWPRNSSNTILSYLEYSGDNYVYNGTIQEKIIHGFNSTISGLDGKIGNKVDMKSKFYVQNNDGEGRIFRIDYSYVETYEQVSSLQDLEKNAPVYVRKYMLKEKQTDDDVLVPENEEKKYQITVTEQKGGDYIKKDDEYIQVQEDTGNYTIKADVSNSGGTYIDVYGKTTDTDKSNYIYYAYYKDLPLSYYLEDNGTASNNQMYHVVITSTSGDYQLGRPIMKKDTDNEEIVDPNNLDNDNLVSPSFMLASQLGNSSTINWEEAKNQCKNYVEVGINGEVYDDWRLPTAAEINIIIKYQTDPKVNTKDDKAVMDYVLNYAGQSTPDYWVSRYNYSMQIPENGEGTLHAGKENLGSNRRVRCVRDFHVGEPTE